MQSIPEQALANRAPSYDTDVRSSGSKGSAWSPNPEYRLRRKPVVFGGEPSGSPPAAPLKKSVRSEPHQALSTDELQGRLARLNELLLRADLDAALVSSESNFVYCTGYTTPSWVNVARPMAALVKNGYCTAFVSRAEAERMSRDAPTVDVVGYTDPAPSRTPEGDIELDFGLALAECVGTHLNRQIDRLGVELSGVPGGLAHAGMQWIAQLARAELRDVGPIFRALRSKKSPYEVSCLREAAQALGRAYARFESVASVGLSERQIREELSACAVVAGCDRLSMVTVVAGAMNPLSGQATERIWGDGDLLMIDVGLTYQGYWADLSRHFVAGDPTPTQMAAYNRLTESFNLGRKAARVGAKAEHVADALSAGLPCVSGKSTGRVGHGIGLDITEVPSLAVNDDTVLAEGNVLCLEPNAWFDDVGYLIGEEMVVVTEHGAELLSPPFPRTLPVIDRN